jgi:hypothetical protein
VEIRVRRRRLNQMEYSTAFNYSKTGAILTKIDNNFQANIVKNVPGCYKYELIN